MSMSSSTSALAPVLACCRQAVRAQSSNAGKRAALPVAGARRIRSFTTSTRRSETGSSFQGASTSGSSFSGVHTGETRPATVPGSQLHLPEASKVARHLNDLFEGLNPPLSPELAMRMVTHKGSISPNAPAQLSQHNARLAFLGRRILRLYLSIFYHAHKDLLHSGASDSGVTATGHLPRRPAGLREDDLDEILSTPTLGRFVGTRWELDGNMQWRQLLDRMGRPSGFHKISGQAVEAVIGGIFRQYGAATALQVFNSRILPFLPLPPVLERPARQLARVHGNLSSSAVSYRENPQVVPPPASAQLAQEQSSV